MKAHFSYLKWSRVEKEPPFAMIVILESGAFGYAICNVKYEGFSKKKARKIAIGRALLSIKNPERYRKMVDKFDLKHFEENHNIRGVRVFKKVSGLMKSWEHGELGMKNEVEDGTGN